MNPLYIKAVHIIGVVTWFAGLFYLVRLFIYHTEAETKAEPERTILQNQFKIMERRLWYGITWPSMILVVITGFWLVYIYKFWLQPFMLVKFGFVTGLLLYHFSNQKLFSLLQHGKMRYSSLQLRIWNEVATLFLVTIVFVIVLKNETNWIWGLAGLLVFSGAIMLGIRWYKKSRETT